MQQSMTKQHCARTEQTTSRGGIQAPLRPIRSQAAPAADGICSSRNGPAAGVVCCGAAAGRSSRRRERASWIARAVVHDEEDLLQHPDRIKWYESKFCADDMPDWTAARLLSSTDIAPGMRHVVLETEVSREHIPLRNAYKAVGQRASIRVNNGVEYHLTVASPPFSMALNKDVLFRTRGDLFAYEVKTGPKEPLSVKGELHLMVTREEAPDVYDIESDAAVEVGPYRGGGLDLKGSGILAIYQFPTLVLFVSGKGIAHARALLTATADVANLTPQLRKDIRVYYKVPNAASACYSEDLQALEGFMAPCTFRLVQTTKGFGEAFDDDDTLEYQPETTAALVLTGGDAEEEAAALEACRDAEITTLLCDSREQSAPVYLASVPPSFMRWKKDQDDDEDAAAAPPAVQTKEEAKREVKGNVVPLAKPGKGARR